MDKHAPCHPLHPMPPRAKRFQGPLSFTPMGSPADSLPIEDALPRLRHALAHSGAAVLQAPPGAGKTTRVPPALLDEAWLAGRRIVMLEPRRLAARAAASYMADMMGDGSVA